MDQGKHCADGFNKYFGGNGPKKCKGANSNMSEQSNSKITSGHLERNAYLYVRQSTLRQVVENSESTKRQYGLKQRALGLGWRNEQICVIDNDLGESGASTERDGFKTLVSEVGMGHAGIVMGLEVSR